MLLADVFPKGLLFAILFHRAKNKLFTGGRENLLFDFVIITRVSYLIVVANIYFSGKLYDICLLKILKYTISHLKKFIKLKPEAFTN